MPVNFDPTEFGKAMGVLIRDAVDPLQREIADLHKQLAELKAAKPEKGERGEKGEQGERGEKGDSGPAGQDATPLDAGAIADDVVARLLDSERLKTLADLSATEAVADHFRENPVQHGRDGRDGRDGADGRDGKDGARGEQGERGSDGADGRDGLDVRDMLRSRDDHLIAVMSDGTTRDLGEFVGRDGVNGKDGVDGLSMADVSREYDAETHEVVERWSVGGVAKELRYPAGGIRPGGFWSDGKKSLAGEAVTHDGALWIARRDTLAKPSRDSADWQIAARKGRDGKDGRNGIDKTAAVKVGDDS